ncbi:unannotated protein [freshwater metagenome]|uniref:Unannotated protein n=1 Tax=freshwater metagenome TaxID=449393 RepID=A0A6J6UB58_9ZZZZ
MTCPYHGQTFESDGALRARPLSASAFDDVDRQCNLRQVAVAERYGLIFVRVGGAEPIDLDAELAGAEDDLASFALDTYHHNDSRTATWAMNWKLFLGSGAVSELIYGKNEPPLVHEFLPRGKVVIQAAGLDPGVSRDIAQPRAVPLLAEHCRRSVEDAGPRPLGLRPWLREVRLLRRIQRTHRAGERAPATRVVSSRGDTGPRRAASAGSPARG